MHVYTNPPSGSEDDEEAVDVLRLKFAKARRGITSMLFERSVLILHGLHASCCCRCPFESMMVTRAVGAFVCQLLEAVQY